MNVLLLDETCMVQASVHWFGCFSVNSCGKKKIPLVVTSTAAHPQGVIQFCFWIDYIVHLYIKSSTHALKYRLF